jgi:catechol 2,3-dioxygenase-like lactoylglutathione lyase family enzyme
MPQSIAHLALIVRDYDEAIQFFTEKMDFHVVEDRPVNESKRWALVAPANSARASLLLAKAANDQQASRIGNQTGGRVFLFLHTDNFWRDYERMKSRGVKFAETAREEPYGTVAVFEDLYGNRWDLLQRK